MAEKFTKKPILTERFDEAMQMALEHHRGHLRKDTTVPYVSHLLAVVAIVLELGGDEDAGSPRSQGRPAVEALQRGGPSGLRLLRGRSRAFATVYEDPPATLAVSELDALASEMCRHAGVDPDAAAGEVTREDTSDSTVGHDRE